MTQQRGTIFRAQALHHYRNKLDRAAFPKLAAPRLFLTLWLLFALLVLGLALAASAELPVYVEGRAFDIGTEAAQGGRRRMAVLLPSKEEASALRPGQKTFLRSMAGEGFLVGRVTAVRDGGELDASVAEVRPGINATAVASLAGAHPSAVALIELEAGAQSAAPQPADCVSYEARVEVGSRRLWSLLSGR